MRKNAFVVDAVEVRCNDSSRARNWRELRREANKATRIYVHPSQETVLDQLVKRRVRPVAEWRRLMPEILERAGLSAQKVRWSQRAGCSCPCSPGFICEDSWGKTVYVTVSEAQ